MAFKHIHLQLVVLTVLLAVTAGVTGWALAGARVHLSILTGTLVIAEAIWLFRVVTKTNREILFFFRALKNDDTSIHFAANRSGRLMEELHRLLDQLNQNFQQIRMNNEVREQYFSRILENLSSGLMVISETGHVNQVNAEALRLLGLPHLNHIRSVEEKYPKLFGILRQLKHLEKSEVVLPGGEGLPRRILGLRAVEIILKGEKVRILTLQDLSLELERKEIEGWIRLIRVLSHEIMNSLAPITSISTTLKEVWANEEENENDQHDPRIRQTTKGLDAIAEQSEGLTRFFESYRVLSRIPDPVLSEFMVCEMLDKLKTLMVHDPENEGIGMEFACKDADLKLQADEQMITNVLVNLIKNGVQALQSVSSPQIRVSVDLEGGHVICRVADNGKGIPPHIAEEIFMPFFTTRERGTGVGLSYSRQVMHLHGGVIEFDSVPGSTEFRLLFPGTGQG